MKQEVAKGPMKDCVKALIANKIELAIKNATNRIFPLDMQNALHIHKAKLIKKPKMDITKLLEIHNKNADDGAAVEKEGGEEKAKNLVDA